MTLQQVPLPLTNTGFSGYSNRRKRWDDGIPWLEFADGKWLNLRFFGPSEAVVYMIATHWLTTIKNKKRFPMLCPNFNSVTRDFEKNGCPICEDLDPFNSENKTIKECSPRLSGLTHALVRSIQKAGGNSEEWKPWRPVRMPISVLISLQKLRDRNLHVIEGKEYSADVTDPYYGRDVSILYDSQGSNPQNLYAIDKGDHTPLTEDEQGMLKELYTFKDLIEYPDHTEMKKALTQNGYYQMLHSGSTIAVPEVEPPPSPMQTFTPVPPAPPTPTVTQTPVAHVTQTPVAPVAAQAPVAPAPRPPLPSTGGVDVGSAGLREAELDSKPEHVSDVEIPFRTSNPEAAPVALSGNAANASSDLQGAIVKFSEGLTRGTPLQDCDKGDLVGLKVLACFGAYKGDMHCVRCPIRKNCLQA